MNTKNAALAAAVALSLLLGVILGSGAFRKPEPPAAAATPAAPVEPPPKPKESVYVGRWHTKRTGRDKRVGNLTINEWLTFRSDGFGTRLYSEEIEGFRPHSSELSFRWEEKDGQLVAFITDKDAVNENGDEADIIGIVRPDGRLAATLMGGSKPTVTYDRVPVAP